MIFDGAPIEAITDDELRGLVREHTAERRHLEFKVTVNHKDDADRLETLLDIASIANGGGGYLLVGIRDDGKGRAQVFEDPGDTTRIAHSIRDQCLEHIDPRIDGLAIQQRTVDGHQLVVVRVPVSARTPHMVTFQRGTHFCTRYDDGKREMTLAEIRSAFTEDLLNRRLSSIELGVSGLARPRAAERREELAGLMRAGEPLARLAAVSGEDLSRVDAEAFRIAIGTRAGFYLSATPDRLDRRSVDVDRDEIRAMFRHAPGSRRGGWIVTNTYAEVERFAEGIRYRNGTLEVGILELLTNGHLRYACLLGENFYWRMPAEEVARRPRIWPYPVVEYPLSFFTLFQAVARVCELRPPFHVRVEYHNIAQHLLPPGPPTEFGFLRGHEARPYSHTNLVLSASVDPPFEAHAVTYQLVRDLYAAFGYGTDAIPFWDEASQRFNLPER